MPASRLTLSLVSAPKIAAAMDQLHHSFTQPSVGKADFHALGCAPGAWGTVAKLVFAPSPARGNQRIARDGRATAGGEANPWKEKAQ